MAHVTQPTDSKKSPEHRQLDRDRLKSLGPREEEYREGPKSRTKRVGDSLTVTLHLILCRNPSFRLKFYVNFQLYQFYSCCTVLRQSFTIQSRVASNHNPPASASSMWDYIPTDSEIPVQAPFSHAEGSLYLVIKSSVYTKKALHTTVYTPRVPGSSN